MYTIKRTDRKITSIWDKNWENAQLAEIKQCPWAGREPNFNTSARILYDDYGMYVRLETDEPNPVAQRTEQNSDVCEDSCMEFFISPNENDAHYINFEFNAYGTMYMSVRASRHEFFFPPMDRSYFEVQSYVDNKRWVLQFVIPFAFCEKYFGAYTKNMRGNLYKCGTKGDQKHNATYYRIDTPAPDYHLPEFFGPFVLE